MHSSFISHPGNSHSGVWLHLWSLREKSWLSPLRSLVGNTQFSDNTKIPSSRIITAFYSPWHEAQGVKSWLATWGHREGNYRTPTVPAFICCPRHVMLWNEFSFGTNITEVIWNTLSRECVTATARTHYYFSNNGIICQLFLRRLHVWMCIL